MGLFSKKAPTLEDILSALDGLSEDEIAKVKEKMDGILGAEEKPEEAEQPEETTDGAEEDPATEAEENAEPAAEDAEEPEAPAEETDNEEDPHTEGEESMPPPEEETPGEEPTAAEEEPAAASDGLEEIRELIRGLTARLDSFGESHGKLAEQVAQIVDNYDKRPFGNHPQHAPDGGANDNGESAVMRSYNSKQTNFR